MPRIPLTLLVICLCYLSLRAQEPAAANTDKHKKAKVNVFVTDMSGRPSKGEQVLFKSNTSQKTISGFSDAAGRLTVELPAGAMYTITVKSVTDTARYGSINIPALKPGEFFTEPFKVNIKYEAAKTYTLNNVHFDSGKSTLRPESFPALEELYAYLKNKEDIKVEIAGHTDSRGKDTVNLKLSQQRAEAIRDYLIKKGIPPARVIAKGYGSTEPVADNETEEGRQLNRRTEVRIL